MPKRILLLLTLSVFLILTTGTIINAQAPEIEVASQIDTSDYRATMMGMLDELLLTAQTFDATNTAYTQAAGFSGDPLYIAPLIDIAFFTRLQDFLAFREVLYRSLRLLSGEELVSDWETWLTWASEENVALPPHYDEFKGELLSAIVDPRFADFFQAGVQETAQTNMMEAVWGGVRVDGIPSLVNARQISPEDARLEGETLTNFCNDDDCSYPADDELVFGVSINGDNRAYPLRILNWHEMFNDVIGHVPMYDAPNGEVVCNFRAPRNFRAVAHHNAEWVQIMGDSAGCPFDGWLENPESLAWVDADDWESAQELLPDVAIEGENALLLTQGIVAHVAGTPVMMAYCTLCGSGILFDPIVDNVVVDGENIGTQTLEFGSTGMLMRSNKLMYDRTTLTVWNHITGEPIWGPLAESGTRLGILPMVTIDWATWLEMHPDTSVLSLDTGYPRDYTNGGAYTNYFNNTEETMFPVWQTNTEQIRLRDMVFALTINDIAKAYPLNIIIDEVVSNDTIDDQNIVLVTQATPERDFFEPGGAAVRAYEREDYVFSAGSTALEVIDQDGGVWEVTEDALLGSDGERLTRIGGNLAFWFGWFSFNPDTLVYGEQAE